MLFLVQTVLKYGTVAAALLISSPYISSVFSLALYLSGFVPPSFHWSIWLSVHLSVMIESEIFTGRSRAICGQRYPFPCFVWLWTVVRESRAVAPNRTKSCRAQEDFYLSVYLSVSVYPSIHLSIHPFVCPSIHPFPQALSGLKFGLSGLRGHI